MTRPTPTNPTFLDELETAGHRREIVQLVDPQGQPLAALPLFRLPPGASPELLGVSSSAPPEDRIAVVAHRRPRGKPPTWDLELVDARYSSTRGDGRGGPVLAPPPNPSEPTDSPLAIREILGWAARLGVSVVIRYGLDQERRTLGDLRIVHLGPIRCTDLGKGEPRSFALAKIGIVVSAAMAWDPDRGFTPTEGTFPRARRA